MSEVAAVMVPVAALKAWAGNPRKNDPAVDEVAASIKRFGFGSPIIARQENGEVICGHTRLKAAIRLKLASVPVRYLDLSAEEAHAYALADNKLGEIATWDQVPLADAFRDLEKAQVDLSGLGWDGGELEKFLGHKPGGLGGGGGGGGVVTDPDEDDLPEPPAVPVSKPGEVYELGPHRLVCGDCRNIATVTALLGGRKINLAFTSPPYAAQREYDESSGFKPIPPDEYVAWFEAVQAAVRVNLAPDGSWFVNIKEHCEGGQRHLYVKDLTIAHVRQWGWMLIDEFAWVRKGVPGGWQYRFKNEWEPCFHFATAAPKCNKYAVAEESDQCFDVTDRKRKASASVFDCNAENGKVLREGLALPGNVVTINGKTEPEHNAGFPSGLPEWFIRAFSDVKDAVYDPFMGSGTTLVAAAKHGRVAFGTEISPRYCDVIRRRWTRYARANNLDAGPGALDGGKA